MPIVWITGASSGIGKALAEEHLKKGDSVILSARRKEILDELASQYEHATPLPLDLTDEQSIIEAVNVICIKFGKVDTLVHCGGISQRAAFEEMTLQTFKRVMDVNFWGAVMLTKQTLPLLRFSTEAGIIVISSVVGKFGTPYRTAYSASKHALHGFFDALRAEEHPLVKVMLVCPRYVNTAISENALRADGTTYAKKDGNQSKGLPPEFVAKKISNAFRKGKKEIYMGGVKELTGVWLKRWWPSLLRRMVIKV